MSQGLEGVEQQVIKVIAESLCQDESTVQLKSNLVRDLGAESIDFLDILFRLEKEFQIKIPQREIERMARGGLTPEEFEIDSILQPKGVERLRTMLPEIDPAEFREGMSLRELPALFTVEVFANIVKRKLVEFKEQQLGLKDGVPAEGVQETPNGPSGETNL